MEKLQNGPDRSTIDFSDDPFSPENIADEAPSRETELNRQKEKIIVGKPGPQDFWRVHPDPKLRINTSLLKFKRLDRWYLVARPLRAELDSKLTKVRLAFIGTVGGSFIIWPVVVPSQVNPNAYHVTAEEAWRLGMKFWVNMAANQNKRRYDFETRENDEHPIWPELTSSEIFKIAFGNYNITSMDHPVIQELLYRKGSQDHEDHVG